MKILISQPVHETSLEQIFITKNDMRTRIINLSSQKVEWIKESKDILRTAD